MEGGGALKIALFRVVFEEEDVWKMNGTSKNKLKITGCA
jgi:hypothetical protein